MKAQFGCLVDLIVCLRSAALGEGTITSDTAPDSTSRNDEGTVCFTRRSRLGHRRGDSDSDSSCGTACSSSQPDEWKARPSALSVGLTADAVEPWQRFPYLTRGYRRGGNYVSCACSLPRLHNETFNAWTMVIRCVERA
jgi:hypothetical protein